MFGSKNTNNPLAIPGSGNTNSQGESGLTCVIAPGTVIEGKFTCTENVRIDGTILGEIKVEKRLVMGESGVIEGKINATNSIVQGTIEGNLMVEDTLYLQNSAKIKGTILSAKLVVDEGAKYNGECRIGEKFMKKNS